MALRSCVPCKSALPNDALSAVTAVTAAYDYRMTSYLRSLLQDRAADDPLVLQFTPDERELQALSYEMSDPIGDIAFSPVKGGEPLQGPTLDAAIDYIAAHPEIWVDELTDSVVDGLRRLTERGVMLLSQTVLLKGVNNVCGHSRGVRRTGGPGQPRRFAQLS